MKWVRLPTSATKWSLADRPRWRCRPRPARHGSRRHVRNPWPCALRHVPQAVRKPACRARHARRNRLRHQPHHLRHRRKPTLRQRIQAQRVEHRTHVHQRLANLGLRHVRIGAVGQLRQQRVAGTDRRENRGGSARNVDVSFIAATKSAGSASAEIAIISSRDGCSRRQRPRAR